MLSRVPGPRDPNGQSHLYRVKVISCGLRYFLLDGHSCEIRFMFRKLG